MVIQVYNPVGANSAFVLCLGAVDPAIFCVTGVALDDIHTFVSLSGVALENIYLRFGWW